MIWVTAAGLRPSSRAMSARDAGPRVPSSASTADRDRSRPPPRFGNDTSFTHFIKLMHKVPRDPLLVKRRIFSRLPCRPRRDADAARRLFHRALTAVKVRPPEVVTDAAPTCPGVFDELVPAAWHHVERYASNRI